MCFPKKELKLFHSHTKIGFLAVPFISCVIILRKLLNLSKTQFSPLLKKKSNNKTFQDHGEQENELNPVPGTEKYPVNDS